MGLTVRSIRRTIALVIAAVAVASFAVLGVSALYVVLGVGAKATDGRGAFEQGRRALAQGDAKGAEAAFERGRAAFASALARSGSVLAVPARVVPLAGGHVGAVQAMMRAGELGSRAGLVATEALVAASPDGVVIRGGGVDAAAADRAAPLVRSAAALARTAADELEDAPDGWLLEPAASALAEARASAAAGTDGITRLADAIDAIPSLLGRGTTRRYLIALTNPSELRGTGGAMEHVAVVEATDGRLALDPDSARPVSELPPLDGSGAPEWFVRAHEPYGATSLWRNVNVSADLPAVTRTIAGSAAAALGPIDGVVLLTPDGLAALVGPERQLAVASWPASLAASNLAQVLEHDMFVRYEGEPERRAELRAEVLQTAIGQVLAGEAGFTDIARMGAAAAAGHIQVSSARDADRAALVRLGAAGSVDRARFASDALGVVTSNAVGNAIDWYLRREVSYHVTLDPHDRSATTELVASFVNKAPATGESADVIEPARLVTESGANRQIVLVVRPPRDRLTRFEIGGRARPAVRAAEGGMVAYHAGVLVPPGERTKLDLRSTVPDALRGDDELVYRLRILRQPIPHADFYDVSISAPRGWSVQGRTTFVGTLERDLDMEVRLRRTLRARIVDAVVVRPWRAVRDLLG